MPFNLSICEKTLETGYWSWRNTTVNILAVLIVFCNSLLIYVIRSSNTLRKQVHLQKLWKLCKYHNPFPQRFNLVMTSLACTDLLCGILIPFNTLRVCRSAFKPRISSKYIVDKYL